VTVSGQKSREIPLDSCPFFIFQAKKVAKIIQSGFVGYSQTKKGHFSLPELN